MKQTTLNLADFKPTEAQFSLSSFPDRKFTLCRWSLRVRAWAFEKYGAKALQTFFQEKRIDKLAEIAFFMLKEKDIFKTQDDFFDNVTDIQDEVNLLKALIGTIGIGEPEIEKINQLEIEAGKTPDPNEPSPNP